VGLVVLAGGVAQAAPKRAAAEPSVSFYSGATGTCVAGATCAGAGSTDPAGHVVASADYARETSATGVEFQNGYGGARFSRHVDRGTTKLTATFTWTVSGTTSAESTAGRVFSQVWASTWGHDCGPGCTITTSTAVVAESGQDAGVPWQSSRPATATNATVKVTLTFAGQLPRNVVGGSAVAAAGVGRTVPLCLEDGLPGCDVDTGHAGTAHADLDATFVGVEVTTS
jgi:hypothetical protein